jgi:hypothetical protein
MATRWTQADVDAVLRRNGVTTWTVPPAQPKSSKYLNAKTTDAKGIVHDGKGEAQRWGELELLERAGAITRLRRQIVYAFVGNDGVLITTYKADFDYYDGAAHIVEDHKSPRTRKLAAYRHKVKLMQSHYGIQIREVTK